MRPARVALLAASFATAPLAASQASPGPDATVNFAGGTDATPIANDGRQGADFADLFEPFNGPPKPIELPTGAVDLDTFEAPLEQTRVLQQLGTGIASYYGRRFHGRRTANGERFNMRAMTAAHRTLPFGTLVRVTNPRNGREVTVRINDRGPFIRGRSIDLSRAAAEQLGMISRGHARVRMDVVSR